MKQEVQHKHCKAKAFTIVFGQCDKVTKNPVEADSSFAMIESMTDVTKLLQLTMGVVHDASNLKCCFQGSKESHDSTMTG